MAKEDALLAFQHECGEELTLVELGSHLRIEESLRAQDNDKPKGNNVAGPSIVNMVEHNNSSRYNDNIAGNVGNKANESYTKGSVDGSSSSLKGATVHVCKDRCWFKTYESLNNRSILHMGNESTALVHGRGCVDLRLGHVHFKRMQDMSKDGLILAFDMDTEK
nr:zinc finger, CCHC-type [Tanacetum cinerariifolium]